MTQNYIGVDLSKTWLDIHDPATARDRRVANTAPAIGAFLAALGPHDMLVFEATSGCDRALSEALRRTGRPHRRLNPLHAWHFAQSLNQAKTDRLDARMLARMGAERRLEPAPMRSAEAEALADLAQRRDQLKRMETQEKNRLSTCADKTIAADIRASLRALARRIARFEALIRAHIATHEKLDRKARLLRSVPGIGAVSTTTLLAHLPELGEIDRRAVASLAGLAPRARDSGKFRGQRRLGAGRRHIRRVLYMAAVAIWRAPGPFADFIRRLSAAGKPAKVILMAIARKIVVIANAVLRHNTPFKPSLLNT